MCKKAKNIIILIAVFLPILYNACGKPTLKNTEPQPDMMIFTENVNFERKNFIAKDFPYPLTFITEKSINGVTTPNLGLVENHIFITTLTGYLSIIPIDDIGKNHKTRLSKGMSASSTLYGDRLFIPMVAGPSGLQVYDIKTGEIIWELKGHYSHSSPVVVNDLVYHVDQQGEILCLNVENGRKIWQAYLDDRMYNNLLYLKDHLIAVSQNGQIQIYEPASGLVNLVKNVDDFVYAQAIAVDQFLYIISYHGILYSINLKTGYISKLDEYNIKVYSSLSSDGQYLFIPLSDGTLICRALEKKENIWSIILNGPVSCPVLITNRHAIAATSQKFLYIIDKQNGEIVQYIKTDGRINAPPVFDQKNVVINYEYDKIALYTVIGKKDVTVQD